MPELIAQMLAERSTTRSSCGSTHDDARLELAAAAISYGLRLHGPIVGIQKRPAGADGA